MAEEVLWKGGVSPLSLLSYWVIGLVLTVTIILSPIGLIVLLLGAIKMLRSNYEVTNERVKVSFGLISKVTREADVDRIQDILVQQGFLGRILNYGNLYFNTSGSTGYEMVFVNVADPNGLKEKFRQAKKNWGK
ncbi:Bacterial PH domain protein [uncultured archaeon]|nr:Bacterial PH domain protein [uncultured archaeon]